MNTYTLYLANKGVKKASDLVKKENGYTPIDPSENFAKLFAEKPLIYIGITKPEDVKIKNILKEISDFKSEELQPISYSLLIILKCNTSKRYFILTYGYARYIVKFEYVERSFGLKVAANCVDPSTINLMETLSTEHNFQKTTKQFPKSRNYNEYGVDNDFETLKKIIGKGKIKIGDQTKDLSIKLSGSSSLNLSLPHSINNINSVLNDIYKNYEKDDYKSNGFSWIDNIEYVTKESDVLDLDNKVIQALKDIKKRKSIYLAESTSIGIKYFVKGDRKKNEITDISIDTIIGYITPDVMRLNIDLVKQFQLTLEYDDNSSRTISIYDLLVYENHDSKIKTTHYLYEGYWVKINKNYYERIGKDFNTVKCSKAECKLWPKLNSITLAKYEEGDYNDYIARNSSGNIILMDRKFSNIGSSSRKSYEFCDLFKIDTMEVIHVKVMHSNYSVSHVVQQALVSASNYKSDHEFTLQTNDKLGASFPDIDRIEKHQLTISLIIICSDTDTFSFFNKMSISMLKKNVAKYGYKTLKVYLVNK